MVIERIKLTDLTPILNLLRLLQCLIFGLATGYILIINEPKNCWLRLFLILIISASCGEVVANHEIFVKHYVVTNSVLDYQV